jgi:hypothetical protein
VRGNPLVSIVSAQLPLHSPHIGGLVSIHYYKYTCLHTHSHCLKTTTTSLITRPGGLPVLIVSAKHPLHSPLKGGLISFTKSTTLPPEPLSLPQDDRTGPHPSLITRPRGPPASTVSARRQATLTSSACTRTALPPYPLRARSRASRMRGQSRRRGQKRAHTDSSRYAKTPQSAFCSRVYTPPGVLRECISFRL